MSHPTFRPTRARAARVPCFALLASLAVSACRTAEPRTSVDGAVATRIRSDIAYLADDRLEGRGTGTAGNDSAAAWLARRHAELGLHPLLVDTSRADCRLSEIPRGCGSYFQYFLARGAEQAHTNAPGLPTRNVVSVVPGSDRSLAGEYVVVGAHFDHLGRSPADALDPEAKNAIRNGADDNASGTAAVLEIARRFSEHPARRPLVIVHFSAEELGLLGSQWFVDHSPVPLDSIVAMLNFDMVGRLRRDRLLVYGTGTARELPALLDSVNTWTQLKLVTMPDGYGPSDQSSCYAKGIPVLHFFTDLHEDYHRATDDVEKIDAAGEARVVALAERMVRAIADRPAGLTPVRAPAKPMLAATRTGSNVYLGTIPDMAASGTEGLRLVGVRAGSPADRGGLAAGDVIVLFGGREVKDLYGYSDALYAHQPGDQVEVVYLRGGARHSTTVTLGVRAR